jgi:hypothetical protein
VSGTICADLVPFALVLDANDTGRFQGMSFAPGDLLYLANGSECDLITAAGHKHLIVHAPLEMFRGVAAGLGLGDPERLDDTIPVVRPDARARAHLLEPLRGAFGGPSPNARTQAERASSAIAIALESLFPPEERKGGPGIELPGRSRHARAARDFIEAH